MATMKLAEALLRRKELQMKLDRIAPINQRDLFEQKMIRKSISESIDELQITIPKVEYATISGIHDHYAKQLRLIDAHIQQANWNTELEVPDSVNMDM